MNVLDVNTFNLRNVYPTAMGMTTGQNGSSMDQQVSDVAPSNGNAPTPVDQAAMIGGQGSAVIAGVIFLALLVGLMFLAKRLGTDENFSSIKPSAYNVLTISLAALVGLPIWKYIFTRFPIPGISTWALAA